METAYLDTQNHFVHNLVSTMTDAVERNMRLDLVSKLGAKLSVEGNQYCYLYGELPNNCVVGFGDTPYDALNDFWKNFHNDRISNPTRTGQKLKDDE